MLSSESSRERDYPLATLFAILFLIMFFIAGVAMYAGIDEIRRFRNNSPVSATVTSKERCFRGRNPSNVEYVVRTNEGRQYIVGCSDENGYIVGRSMDIRITDDTYVYINGLAGIRSLLVLPVLSVIVLVLSLLVGYFALARFGVFSRRKAGAKNTF